MRTRLLNLLLALVMLVTVADADEIQTRCSLVGAVFGTDPFGSMMLIKDSAGYIKNLSVSPATTFLKLPVAPETAVKPIGVAEVNTGDLVCVQNDGAEKPATVSVVTRTDLHRAQRTFLTEWLRNSVYGTVSSVDPSTRTLVVKPMPPSVDGKEIRVSVPSSARLKAGAPQARRITDSVSFELGELRTGEQVYIRGTRANGSDELSALLILKGGLRGVVGTLVEVRVFDSALQIQEFGTSRSLRMKITPGEFYRTTENLTDPMRVATASGVVLTPVGLADLQPGDAILVLGRTSDDSAEGSGVIAVTRFGTLGVAPQDPQNRMTWLLAK